MTSPFLKLGIPKGSLQDATIALFAKAGWNILLRPRNYFPEINDTDIECSLARAQEMAEYVEGGILDAGLTGKDWVEENSADIVVVDDLIYSKASNRKAKWVLCVRADSPFKKPEDLAGKVIYTELVGFTKRYFKSRNIDVDVRFSWGTTEAKVVAKLCDAVVEITETGSTIKANDLRVIAELMETNTQLIANKKAWADPIRRKKIEAMNLLLQGALRAERMVGLKMNLPKSVLEATKKILPALTSPTIAELSDPNWLSIEIVIDKSVVRDIIPAIRAIGAEGIIEYPLNKVI